MANNATPVAPRATAAVVVDRPPKCPSCGRPVGEYMARPWSVRCRKCKTQAKSAPEGGA